MKTWAEYDASLRRRGTPIRGTAGSAEDGGLEVEIGIRRGDETPFKAHRGSFFSSP